MKQSRRYPLILLLTCLASNAAAYDLQRHQWHDRLLILIADDAQDPEVLERLQAITSRQAELDDRQLRLLQLYRDSGRIDERVLPSADVHSLRAQLAVTDTDRQLLLIGKDGGIKRRAPLATDLQAILQQIDGMPMRRAEMARRAQALP